MTVFSIMEYLLAAFVNKLIKNGAWSMAEVVLRNNPWNIKISVKVRLFAIQGLSETSQVLLVYQDHIVS